MGYALSFSKEKEARKDGHHKSAKRSNGERFVLPSCCDIWLGPAVMLNSCCIATFGNGGKRQMQQLPSCFEAGSLQGIACQKASRLPGSCHAPLGRKTPGCAPGMQWEQHFYGGYCPCPRDGSVQLCGHCPSQCHPFGADFTQPPQSSLFLRSLQHEVA